MKWKPFEVEAEIYRNNAFSPTSKSACLLYPLGGFYYFDRTLYLWKRFLLFLFHRFYIFGYLFYCLRGLLHWFYMIVFLDNRPKFARYLFMRDFRCFRTVAVTTAFTFTDTIANTGKGKRSHHWIRIKCINRRTHDVHGPSKRHINR